MIVPSIRRLFSSTPPPLSNHAQLVANLVHLAQRGLLTLYPQRGDNILIAVPDLDQSHDWYVVAACGHVSTGHVYRSGAEQWQCAVCDEARLSVRNLDDLSARLRFLALHESQSVAPTSVNATQSRFHGARQ